MTDVLEEDRIPLTRDTDDRNDDDDGATTEPQPDDGASAPEPGNPMTTHLPTERGPTTADNSFIERLPDIPGLSTADAAKSRLEKEFPFAKKNGQAQIQNK